MISPGDGIPDVDDLIVMEMYLSHNLSLKWYFLAVKYFD